MFAPAAVLAVLLTAELKGEGRTIVASLWDVQANRAGSVDAASLRLTLESEDGDRLPIVVQSTAGTTRFAIPNGVPPGMYRGTVEVAAAGGVSIEPPEIYIPSPPSEDTELQHAIDRYAGKTVYGAASWLQYDCTGVQEVQPTYERGTPMRVTAISRVDASALGYYTNKPDPDYLAIQPLDVTFAPVPSSRLAGVAFGGLASPNVAACGSPHRSFAGPWELERFFFLRSPFDHPEWPKRFRAAVQDGKVVPGMTHEMVANVLGYPDGFASIAQLDKLQQWSWFAMAPFTETVTFKGDRVLRYDPAPSLP